MKITPKAKLAVGALLCSVIASAAAVPAQAASAKFTMVYCETDGTKGLPGGGIDQFITVSGRGTCLDFGEKTQDKDENECLIGGRFDNVTGDPISSVTFNLYDYNKSAGNRLTILMYFVDSKGVTTYAYAYASAPSGSKTLKNGDTQLTFDQNAFSTIPSGVSLQGGTVKNLQILMVDSADYTPATFIMYGLTLNGSSVPFNTKEQSPVSDCTF